MDLANQFLENHCDLVSSKLLQFFSLKSPTLLESKLIVPSEIFEIVAGNNPIIAKEETDFPEPDSPQSLGFHCAANHDVLDDRAINPFFLKRFRDFEWKVGAYS
jgi:hypothetical protein